MENYNEICSTYREQLLRLKMEQSLHRRIFCSKFRCLPRIVTDNMDVLTTFILNIFEKIPKTIPSTNLCFLIGSSNIGTQNSNAVQYLSLIQLKDEHAVSINITTGRLGV